MTPTSTTPNRTPPRSPRITSQVPAHAPPRRLSKLLLPTLMRFPGHPTLVVLTTGGAGHMSDTLIEIWRGSAIRAECNFCAIEVGDAAESDVMLPGLLRDHVPQGALLYILQRDADVCRNETEQLQKVLDRLDIPVACDEPLNADHESAWVFSILDETKLPVRVGSMGSDLSLEEGRARMTPEEARHMRAEDAGIQQALAATNTLLEQSGMQLYKVHKEIMEMEAQLATLKATITPGGRKEATKVIMDAFNQLQFSQQWQAVAGTPGAKAVYQTMALVCLYLDEGTRSAFKVPLKALLLGMRNDPALLQSVLNAADKLTADMTCVAAVSRMYIAYMEHKVASGALDNQPLVALGYARFVQRSTLLEQIYQSKRAAAQDSTESKLHLDVDLCIAFDAALTAVLCDAGERGCSAGGLNA